jgi:hypothetical protein
MTCRAILLVEAALGKSVQVLHCLRELDCVKSADRVTPPYDVIAIVEVDASREVTDEVQRLPDLVDGIIRMVVCSIQDFDLPLFSPPQDGSLLLSAGQPL